MRTNLAVNVSPHEVRVNEPWRLTDRKIRSFGELPSGWRYGEGVPISIDVQDAAIAIHHQAIGLGLYNVDVAPGARNQIQIAISNKNDNLEFTIEHNPQGSLTVEFYHENNGEEVELTDDLTLEEAHNRLKEYSKRRWTSSDSSIRMNFFQDSADLRALRSKTPQVGEFRLSVASA